MLYLITIRVQKENSSPIVRPSSLTPKTIFAPCRPFNVPLQEEMCSRQAIHAPHLLPSHSDVKPQPAHVPEIPRADDAVARDIASGFDVAWSPSRARACRPSLRSPGILPVDPYECIVDGVCRGVIGSWIGGGSWVCWTPSLGGTDEKRLLRKDGTGADACEDGIAPGWSRSLGS
ncbi:hypothetical protein BU16DRAFT_540813 [Lophium mytilinum]|uniref:Uncharacterized protein n=1 Tax=Lophium mytilinum TaxID=390894 RepID=A0A6A6QPK7_9PEZI|nr:hypothetical protein BU16DRAFT_540813 [Lophium mytilinum]